MRREIQVHFENCGQLCWHEDIENVDSWIEKLSEKPRVIAHDAETGRCFYFKMATVTAIIIVNKLTENDTDLWRRTYAFKEGNITQDSQPKHQGNDEGRTPPETIGSRCY